MATKVAIQYGVLTGKRVGRRFRQALAEAGYEHVGGASHADIIVAHSAGCFWLPENNRVAVLVNPPYWPGKPIKQRSKERMHNHLHFRANGYSFKYWLWRTWWGVYYAVADMARHRRMARHAETYDLLSLLKNRRVLIIRDSRDEWLTPRIDEVVAGQSSRVDVVHIEGDHDNIWHDPTPYINAIKKFSKP